MLAALPSRKLAINRGRSPQAKGRHTRKQGSGVMLKTVYAIAAAAIIAGAFVAFLSLAMQVEASAHVAGAKGDRADARPLAGDCSRHAWPYFEASCLRDARNPYGEARTVRIVYTDRIR
jgi:hypothetical protein